MSFGMTCHAFLCRAYASAPGGVQYDIIIVAHGVYKVITHTNVTARNAGRGLILPETLLLAGFKGSAAGAPLLY